MQVPKIGTYTNPYSTNKNQQSETKNQVAFGTLNIALDAKNCNKFRTGLGDEIVELWRALEDINNRMGSIIQDIYKNSEYKRVTPSEIEKLDLSNPSMPDSKLIKEDNASMYIRRLTHDIESCEGGDKHTIFITLQGKDANGEIINIEGYGSSTANENYVAAATEASVNAAKDFTKKYVGQNGERYLPKQEQTLAQ